MGELVRRLTGSPDPGTARGRVHLRKSRRERVSGLCLTRPAAGRPSAWDTAGPRLLTGTLGRAPDRDAAAPLASGSPDSGLLGWSCRKSLKTAPWEAGEEKAQGQS